jgi:hypothetical protein
MTATAVERYNIRIRLQEFPSASIEYGVFGSEDEDDVYDALEAAVASVFRGIPLKGIDAEHLGAGVWDCVAEYNFERGNDTDPAFTFDTTGGSARITQSKETVQRYAAAGGLPDYGGAIGVTKDSIEGCDILVPTYKWTETFFFDAATVDGAFKATIFALTGTFNSGSFRGFNAGEVLFEGVRGAKRGAGRWELTYYFAASPNVTGLTVGTITGISKKGWEYLWVRYYDFDDTTANALVKRPVYVLVERTYDPGDMSLLGIGA